ncbi:MAG TPA: aldehyde dehydrogenase [Solirubrobacteraceae bacterium]|nr:aldehyde dehydrogenase [Solirubrobacteraceae bacterium]
MSTLDERTDAAGGPARATELRRYEMLIGGEWVKARSGKTFESIDPYTGRPWALIPEAGSEDVDAAVRSARRAFDDGPWGRTTAVHRGRLMRRLGELIAERASEIAVVESTDNGKVLRETEQQLAGLADYYGYFAGAADKLQGNTIPSDRTNFLIYTTREPVGVVGAITPWNSPVLLLSWKLAPALAAGCTFVVKPAEQAPASTLEFARLMEEAGFPPGVLNVVTGLGPEVGGPLAAHPGVDKVAFTGSTATGASVMGAAATHVARVSLELGGKSPNIVFADADLEAAANGIVAGVFAATGQTCMAGSRLLVAEPVYDELLERVARRARAVRMGDPLRAETEMGPVAFEGHLERVLGSIAAAQDEGARLVTGGIRPSAPGLAQGLFVAPTLFADVDNSMRIAREEVFGPVAAAIRFREEEEAVRLANDTAFGLAAGIWTKDVQRAHRVARAIRAGTIWINAYRAVGPMAPFGGFKASGYGRENGLEALHEYTEVKTVWVELSGASRDPFKLG